VLALLLSSVSAEATYEKSLTDNAISANQKLIADSN
jgi:hypothetical protein